MKRFRFTLESVSTVRQQQEQKALEKYAQSLSARQRAIDVLRQAEENLAGCWQEMRRQMEQGCVASVAAQTRGYEKVLAQQRDECERQVEAADRRVALDLQAMLKARQQRQIVDKYFDKQKEKHQREQAVQEQKNLDELAGRRRASIFAFQPMENPV